MNNLNIRSSKSHDDQAVNSPKSQELESESKIFSQLKDGVGNFGRMYLHDSTPFQQKIDMQESLVWSDKNMSMSMTKTGINQHQISHHPYELENFSKLPLTADLDAQNKTLSKTNISMLLNPNQINSQIQLQPDLNATSKNLDLKQVVTQKSLLGLDKRQSGQQSMSPVNMKYGKESKEAKTLVTAKSFRIMMLAKKFQDIMLKKSQKYVFRKQIDENKIPYKFLGDKAFFLEDYKKQEAFKLTKHYSIGKFVFDVITFFVILTNIVYLPIKHSYSEIFNVFNNGLIERLTLYYLLIEIFTNMSTQFYQRGLLVKDRVLVSKNYLQEITPSKRSLCFIKRIDLLVGLPYLISLLHPRIEPLNLIYLIRCRDFVKIFNKIEDKFLNNSHFGDAIKCILLIFFVAHLSACSIYEISLIPRAAGEKCYLDSIDVDESSWFQVYIYSFYWSIITMTTIGYGDIHPFSHRERIYAAFFAILSAVIFGFTLNQIGSIISNVYQNSNIIRKKQAIIDSYLKERNIAPDLQIRVKKNIEYILTDNQQQDKVVEEILNSLTNTLRNQLKMELYKKILKSIQSFQINFSEQFLLELCTLFQEQTFNQEQYLYEEEDHPDRFYFILRGEVELFYKSIKCPFPIGQQDSFGVEEFLSQQPRIQSAKTTRVSTVAYICYDEFNDILKKFPSDMEKYRMIYDSYNVNKQTARVFVRCLYCKSISHVFSNCPYLFYIKCFKTNNKLSVIQNYTNSQTHYERGPIESVIKKRRTFRFKCKGKDNIDRLWKSSFDYLWDNIEYITLYMQNQILNNNEQENNESQEGEGEEDEEHHEEEEEGGDGEHANMRQTAATYQSDKNSGDTPFAVMHMIKSLKQNQQVNTGQQKQLSDHQKQQIMKQLFSGGNKSNSNIDIQLLNAITTQENSQMPQNSSYLDVNQGPPVAHRSSFTDFERHANPHSEGRPVPTLFAQQNLLTVGNLPNKENNSFSFVQQSPQKEELQLPNNYQQMRLHQNSSNSSEKSNMTFMNPNQVPNSTIHQQLILHSPHLEPTKPPSYPLQSPQFNQEQQFHQIHQINQTHLNQFPFVNYNDNGNNNNNNNNNNISTNVNSININIQNKPNVNSNLDTPKNDSNLASMLYNNSNSNSNFNNNSKSLSNINSLSNQNSNTPQQSSLAETHKRKSSYFSVHKRKTSELKRDDQSHTKHLMPASINQMSATIDDTSQSHQVPHGTSNTISMLNYNDSNRPHSLSNNMPNPSSGQSNINPMSNLQLEPISPIKNNTKMENTSPMLTLNKDIYTHSEIQFDIQSDQVSPRTKKQNLMDKQFYYTQSPANKLIYAQQVPVDKKKYSSQITIDDYLNPQNILQNKSQLNSVGGDSNSVSIKLDEEEKQFQNMERNYFENTRMQLGENSSRGQSTRQMSSIRKGTTKNNTLLLFGQNQIVNSEIDNNITGNPYQNSTNTLGSRNNDENYNTSYSYQQNNVHETTIDYHPSMQRKKSHKKTQLDFFNEKLNSLQQGSDKKEKILTYLQQNNWNSQSKIRSQRNIEEHHRRSIKQDTVTRYQMMQQYNADFLSQSQETPKEAMPNLKKIQSAKVKSPNLKYQQPNHQQLFLHDQKIIQNKRLVEMNLNYQNQISGGAGTKLSLSRINSNNTHIRQPKKRLSEIQNAQMSTNDTNQSFNFRGKLERKLTNKKASFKITDDQNTKVEGYRINTNSQNSFLQTQTLMPQYDLRDEFEDNTDEESLYKFSTFLDFDSMKQFNDYFPWNNYSKVMRNLFGGKKKKKVDFISLISTKQITKVIKTKIIRSEKDNSDSVLNKQQLK